MAFRSLIFIIVIIAFLIFVLSIVIQAKLSTKKCDEYFKNQDLKSNHIYFYNNINLMNRPKVRIFKNKDVYYLANNQLLNFSLEVGDYYTSESYIDLKCRIEESNLNKILVYYIIRVYGLYFVIDRVFDN